MEFPDTLIKGRLLRRYKRFLADVELAGGEVITAHCANPGSMMGLKEPGATVWLSPARNPKRKLKFSWELIEADGALVGVNTSWPNSVAEEAIAAGAVAELTGYEKIKREVKYGGNSRIDLLLTRTGRPDCYVEIKSVTLMRRAGLAEFPDAVTARGTKHLNEFSNMVSAGHRAVMFYLAQRDDCDRFTIAADIDPAYLEALQGALAAGVEAICYACRIDTAGIEVFRPLEIMFR
jgi:sugar fermentation stimulation protein A